VGALVSSAKPPVGVTRRAGPAAGVEEPLTRTAAVITPKGEMVEIEAPLDTATGAPVRETAPPLLTIVRSPPLPAA